MEKVYEILRNNNFADINELRKYKHKYTLQAYLPTFNKVLDNISTNYVHYYNVEFMLDLGYKDIRKILKSVDINDNLLYLLGAYTDLHKYRMLIVNRCRNIKNITIALLRFNKRDIFTFIKQNNYTIIEEITKRTNLAYHTNDVEFDISLNMSVDMAMVLPSLPYSICYDAIKYKNHELLHYALIKGYKLVLNDRMILTKNIKKVLRKHKLIK